MQPGELYKKIMGRSSVYNIQHIDNIPSIIEHGLLSYHLAQSLPTSPVSIAMNEVQERRDTKFVPNGMGLHDYACTYINPRNVMMYKRKDQHADLCILAIDSSVLDLDGVVISDRNAAANIARFFDPVSGLTKLNPKIIFTRYWNDEDPIIMINTKQVMCAEVLIPNRIDYERIVGAYVSNDLTGEKLRDKGFTKQIAVRPYLFFQGEV